MLSCDITKFFYSDEQTFVISANKRYCYCNFNHRPQHPNQWTVNNTSCQIKCWGMIGYNYKSSLVILDERLDSITFISILCGYVRPIMR